MSAHSYLCLSIAAIGVPSPEQRGAGSQRL
jgi:hypothetical protein